MPEINHNDALKKMSKPCTTCHHACDCREAAHAREVAELKDRARELETALEKIDCNAAESVEWIRRVARDALRAANKEGK